jgi:hypothetical protein
MNMNLTIIKCLMAWKLSCPPDWSVEEETEMPRTDNPTRAVLHRQRMQESQQKYHITFFHILPAS